MTDNNEEVQPQESPDVAPDVSNEEGQDEQKRVPYARFKQVNEKLKELQAQLEQQAREREEQQKQALAEQGKFRELYEQTLKQYEEAQNRLQQTERRLLQQKIAAELNLPPALAERLQGDTEDEMRADAQVILDSIPRPKAPALDGGARGKRSGDQSPLTPEQKAELAAKYGLNPNNIP